MIPPHALVVGGSGMLAGVCLDVARRGWAVSVLARRRAPIESMRARLGPQPTGRGCIETVLADYHDDRALADALAAALERRGPVHLGIAWIHSTAPRAPAIVARAIGAAALDWNLGPVPLYVVLGSVTGDPRYRAIDPAAAEAPGVVLRRIALGWVRGAKGSRWLTDHEIGVGVLDAIRSGAALSEVGTCAPVSERPAE